LFGDGQELCQFSFPNRIFFDAELELYAPPPESELKEEEEDSQLLAPHW